MVETTYMTAEKAYDKVLELLERPEPSSAWVDEFNTAALAAESRDLLDEPEVGKEAPTVPEDEEEPAFKTTEEEILPTSAHQLPWHAWVQENHVGVPSVFIASPPIVINGSAIRLTLDVLQPHRGERDPHINVHAIPCDPKGKMLDKMSSANTACLVIDAEAGPAMIFAGWDFVAREGVDEAIRAGAIVKSWLNVVTAKIPCGDIPPVEEGHAIRMLQVYAAEGDLERAIVEYRIVDKGKSTAAYKAAASYNKINFLLEMREGRRDARTEDEYKGIEYKMANSSEKAFLKWLLNGGTLTGSYWKGVVTKAEKEIYPEPEERSAALRLRLGNADVDNEIKPGLGFAPRIVPAEFCHCTPAPVSFGVRVMGKGGMIREVRDRTARTREIIGACNRLGRARDKCGTPLDSYALRTFGGRVHYDLEGLVILERFVESVSTYYCSRNYVHHAVVIDTRSGRLARLEYTTVDMYGRR
jgi:hypothetical protein